MESKPRKNKARKNHKARKAQSDNTCEIKSENGDSTKTETEEVSSHAQTHCIESKNEVDLIKQESINIGDLTRRTAEWVREQVEIEVERLKGEGIRALPLPVKNTAIVRESRKMFANRIEVNSGFDFNKVSQILVSPPIDCPLKPGFQYVHVICFTDSSTTMPLILPYIFDKGYKKNKLTEWVFINNSGNSTRIRLPEPML